MSDERYRPSKRVRNWHRKSEAKELSLRAFARQSIEQNFGGTEAWKDWFKNKAANR